eukprot:394198-Pelagomonas_calceolata.AAC.1
MPLEAGSPASSATTDNLGMVTLLSLADPQSYFLLFILKCCLYPAAYYPCWSAFMVGGHYQRGLSEHKVACFWHAPRIGIPKLASLKPEPPR